MAHASIAELSDLARLLAAARALPRVQERKPGVFYLRGAAFLHFHVKGERRWADLKSVGGWLGELQLPVGDAAAEERAIQALAEAHAALGGAG